MLISQCYAIAILLIAVAIPLAANAGTFATIYSFKGQADGGNPSGPLTYQSGKLYGTTRAGTGNMFKIDVTTQKFHVVHNFQGTPDSPESGVIFENGVFYGTTLFGGEGCVNSHPIGCGTIFSINAKTAAESILYDFSGGSSDDPVGAGELFYVNGTLYGITNAGGENNTGSFFNFNLSTDVFATLNSFGGTNGAYPNFEFLYQNGLFYGTTSYGGEGVTWAVAAYSSQSTLGQELKQSFTLSEGRVASIPIATLPIGPAHSLVTQYLAGTSPARADAVSATRSRL